MMASWDMEGIAEFFRKMKFRKKFIGGVDEQDVWRQLDALQKEYRRVYDAQAVRYETILAEHGIQTDAEKVPRGSEAGKTRGSEAGVSRGNEAGVSRGNEAGVSRENEAGEKLPRA